MLLGFLVFIENVFCGRVLKNTEFPAFVLASLRLRIGINSGFS